MRSPEDVRAFVGEPASYDPLLLQADEINPVFSDSTFQGFRARSLPADRHQDRQLPAVHDGRVRRRLQQQHLRLARGRRRHRARGAPRRAPRFELEPARPRGARQRRSQLPRPVSDGRRPRLPRRRSRAPRRDELHQFPGLDRPRGGAGKPLGHQRQSAGTRPDVNVSRLRGAFNHRFNRLTVQLRGGIIDTATATTSSTAQVQSNADRNFTLYDQAVRPKWEFSPYLYAFSDIAFNQRDYDIPAFSDGIIRSSTGERYRVGVSFGEVSEILRGTFSLGYGRQTPDSSELEVIDGLLIDADLTWQATALTTLQFTATSEVAETTTFDSGGVMERTYGLEARHNFTQVPRRHRRLGLLDARLRRRRHQREPVHGGGRRRILPQPLGRAVHALSAHRLRQLAAEQQLHRRRGAGRRAPAPLATARAHTSLAMPALSAAARSSRSSA